MASLSKIYGLYSWNWHIVHGSILDMELGLPRLSVREPVVSQSSEEEQVRAMARRRVTPTGEWSLSIETHMWSITSKYGELAGNEIDPANPAQREMLRDMDGQVFTHADLIDDELTLHFDLGGVLRIRRHEGCTLCEVYHQGHHVESIS